MSRSDELDTLLEQLQRGKPVQRRMAALKLGMMRNPLIVPELIDAADDSDDGVRSLVASALASIGQPAISPLQQALNHESNYIRQMAALALQHMNHPDAISILHQHSDSESGKDNDGTV